LIDTGTPRTPGRQLGARLVDDQFADFNDQAARLGQRNEVAWRDHAGFKVMPAQQSLHAEQLTARGVDAWLKLRMGSLLRPDIGYYQLYPAHDGSTESLFPMSWHSFGDKAGDDRGSGRFTHRWLSGLGRADAKSPARAACALTARAPHCSRVLCQRRDHARRLMRS
jgi:hypothetical protein